MLTAIQRKTDGNLNTDEKRLLDHVLYQLRMNYVDVAREQGEAKAEDTPADDAGGPDAGEAKTASDESETVEAPDAGEEQSG
jgi:DNA replication initiation complex subunit (GINS family)